MSIFIFSVDFASNCKISNHMLCNSLDILQKIVLLLDYVDLSTSKKIFGLVAFSPLSTKSHGSTMAPAMAPDGSQWLRPGLARAGHHEDMLAASALRIGARISF